MISQREIALSILNQKALVKTEEFNKAGVHRETIRRMVAAEEIIKVTRGLYSSPEYIPNEGYSLIEARKIVKKGVVCLISALSYHGIGTQNPSEVWMAIPRSSRPPNIENSPIRIITFSGESYSSGIKNIQIEEEEISIYNIPKTIADCFKYRNKIGLEVALEALKDVLQNKRSTVDELLHFAEICRVRNIIKPYMESLV
jgi:predicted transcriptional regulator of viral defense system